MGQNVHLLYSMFSLNTVSWRSSLLESLCPFPKQCPLTQIYLMFLVDVRLSDTCRFSLMGGERNASHFGLVITQTLTDSR